MSFANGNEFSWTNGYVWMGWGELVVIVVVVIPLIIKWVLEFRYLLTTDLMIARHPPIYILLLACFICVATIGGIGNACSLITKSVNIYISYRCRKIVAFFLQDFFFFNLQNTTTYNQYTHT